TSAKIRNGGIGTCGHLRKRSRHTTEEVESGVAWPTHQVFDLWPEGPEEYHVADDVRPAAVHEHCRQDVDPVTAGHDVGGNDRPSLYERFAARQLQHEHQRVERD